MQSCCGLIGMAAFPAVKFRSLRGMMVSNVLWKLLIILAAAQSSFLQETTTDPSLLAQVEKSLLAIMGLKEKPKPTKGPSIVAPYMMQLYRQQEQKEKAYRSKEMSANPLEILYGANTVRSFHNYESRVSSANPSQLILKFNVANIGTEQLRAAELRISHVKHFDYKAAVNDSLPRRKYTRQDMPFMHRISVSDILSGEQNIPKIYRALDTKLVDGRTVGSVSLDVELAVQRWLSQPETNFGLLVQVEPLRGWSSSNTSHIRLKREESSINWESEQPILVTYTDDRRTWQRAKREVLPAHKKSRENCQRYPLYVDFVMVNWSSWIHAPEGYDAYFCKGMCNFPIPRHLNATNHAIVQSIVNSAYPSTVPKPCCVPIELSSKSLLYKDQNDTLVLKTYQDMVVESCGCL